LNIKFGNRQGLFSGYTSQELYDISRKNGCNLSWNEWYGQTNSLTYGTIGTVGSVFCMDLARDMGLSTDEAPGINGKFQFQLQTGTIFKNVNQSSAILPTLYIVGVQEGTFTLTSGNALNQIGVINKLDVLEAQKQSGVNIDQIEKLDGSSFFSVLKDVGKFVKDNKLISRGLSTASTLVPHPVASSALGTASQVAKQLGFGYSKGGALIGGRRMTRSEMRDMLDN
jgi:hypothetical protein